jgi:hypothetical protein
MKLRAVVLSFMLILLKAAKAIDLTIPQSVLRQADRVIE